MTSFEVQAEHVDLPRGAFHKTPRTYVTWDGRPLTMDQAGLDIEFADGKSFFRVHEGRMYRITDQPGFSSHKLKLSTNSDDFALFAFTFGSLRQAPSTTMM